MADAPTRSTGSIIQTYRAGSYARRVHVEIKVYSSDEALSAEEMAAFAPVAKAIEKYMERF